MDRPATAWTTLEPEGTAQLLALEWDCSGVDARGLAPLFALPPVRNLHHLVTVICTTPGAAGGKVGHWMRMASLPWVCAVGSAVSVSGACSSSYVTWMGTRSSRSASRRARRSRFLVVGCAMIIVRPAPSPAAPVGEATRPSPLTRLAGTSGA